MTLTLKKSKFEWSKSCEKSFQLVQDKLTSASVLTLPECTQGIFVYYDASRVGLCCVITHHGIVIEYVSRQLKMYDNNYPTHDLNVSSHCVIFEILRHYLIRVHVYMFADHKSSKFEFTQKDLNLRQRRLLKILKNSHMSVLYHPLRAYLVVDALSQVSMGSVTPMVYDNKELVKEVHRLVRLCVILGYSSTCGFIVHDKSYSSLVVDVKSKKHLDPLLMELKESFLRNNNESVL